MGEAYPQNHAKVNERGQKVITWEKNHSLETIDALWSRRFTFPFSTNITDAEIEKASDTLKRVFMNED